MAGLRRRLRESCRPIIEALRESLDMNVESVDAAILHLTAELLKSSVAYAQKVLWQTESQDRDPAERVGMKKRIWQDVRRMFRSQMIGLHPIFTRFIHQPNA